MYEQEFDLVESLTTDNPTSLNTVAEQVRAVPTARTFPSSNVRLMDDAGDVTPNWSEELFYTPPDGYEVRPGVLSTGEACRMIHIGGTHLNNLEVQRAMGHTEHSQSLAIDGTVSYDDYRTRMESRNGRIRRALGHLVGWAGMRHSPETPSSQPASTQEAARNLTAIPDLDATGEVDAA